jgi:hypothetical protein
MWQFWGVGPSQSRPPAARHRRHGRDSGHPRVVDSDPGDGGDTVNAERGSTRTNPTDDAARFDVESHGPQRATLPPMPWFDR